MKTARDICRLTKAVLCCMVALSAGFGFFLAAPVLSGTLLAVVGGVFFLACGGATLNSIQERELDGLSERTRRRPLVTGSLSLSTAYTVMALCLFSGMFLLGLTGSAPTPPLLGALALLIYNGIYTPLKTRTEFALIAGGVSGSLPPLIGWIAAGGAFADPLILVVMVLFFLWQPPHFCLVALQQRESARQTRLSHLGVRYPAGKVKKIVAVWMLAFTNVSLLLSILPGLLPHPLRVVFVCCTFCFLLGFLWHLFGSRLPRYKILFASLNSYLVGLMVLLSVGATLSI